MEHASTQRTSNRIYKYLHVTDGGWLVVNKENEIEEEKNQR